MQSDRFKICVAVKSQDVFYGLCLHANPNFSWKRMWKLVSYVLSLYHTCVGIPELFDYLESSSFSSSLSSLLWWRVWPCSIADDPGATTRLWMGGWRTCSTGPCVSTAWATPRTTPTVPIPATAPPATVREREREREREWEREREVMHNYVFWKWISCT